MLQSALQILQSIFPLAERKNKVEHKPHDQPLDAHLHLQMEEIETTPDFWYLWHLCFACPS